MCNVPGFQKYLSLGDVSYRYTFQIGYRTYLNELCPLNKVRNQTIAYKKDMGLLVVQVFCGYSAK